MSLPRTFSALAAVAACVAGLAVAAEPAHASGTQPWADGTVFVASSGMRFDDGALYALAPGSGSPQYLGSGSAEDVTVAPDGTVYWVTCSGYLNAVPPGGGSSHVVAVLPNCGTGVAVEPSGKLLVSGFFGTEEMNADGTGATTLSSQQLSSLAVDPAGDIYAAGGGGNLVVRVAGSSDFQRISGLPDDGQWLSVRLAADNSLIVAHGSKVADVPLSGAAATEFGNSFYEGAAVDQAGDLWLSDELDNPSTHDQVDYIAAGGSPVVQAVGFDVPRGLAVYPSPTPAARSASTVTLTKGTLNRRRDAMLTATVDGGAASSGYVQFAIDGNPVGNVVPVTGSGSASESAFLPKGTHHAITATYLGSGTEYPSESTPVYYTLRPLTATTDLSTASTTVAQSQPVDVTATVGGRTGLRPTGDVQFFVNGREVTDQELDSSGTATATLHLPTGTPTVKAVYSGDQVYGRSSSTLGFTTTAPYSSTTSADVQYGTIAPSGKQRINIAVTVTGQFGYPKPTGTITADTGFTCGALVPRATGRTATSTCTARLDPGFYDVLIGYSGDTTYASSGTDANVEVGGDG